MNNSVNSTLDTQSTQEVGATPSVCTVSTIKAPLNIVESFVNYHLNIGIAHMYLFFDDPDDPCITHFRNMDRVTVYSCTKEHWDSLKLDSTSPIEHRQIANAHLALENARENAYSWIIHMDVDELLYTENSLNQYLADLPVDVFAASFRSLEAIPDRLEYKRAFSEISLFKDLQPDLKIRKKITYLLGCRKVFTDGYFKGHVDGKTAVRTNAEIKSLNIHKPTLGNNQLNIVSDKVRLLHYDAMSYQDWHTKWIRRYDGSAKANNLSKPRERQYIRFLNALKSGPEALQEVYIQEYMISKPIVRILKLFGFVKEIHLDSKCFNKPLYTEN